MGVSSHLSQDEISFATLRVTVEFKDTQKHVSIDICREMDIDIDQHES